ncbi:MAG: hypothetical protein ACFFDT_00345, partial [Candidatus Hodarchaeota archaeon]
FELVKLIGKSDSRYDITMLIDDLKAVTVGYLETVIDLTDKNIRIYLKQLINIDYLDCFAYKYRGRWITIFVKNGEKFELQEVIKRHADAQIKKKSCFPNQIKFIGDIPFEFEEYELMIVASNKELGIKASINKDENEIHLINQLKKTVYQIKRRNPSKLDKYLGDSNG